ncbi:MAG: glycosyltransferase family 2 protein [Homoserinimonas sp.]
MASPSLPSSGAPRVAVLTVSYGSEGVLGEFLASVPDASASPVSVIIADNKPEPEGPVATLAAETGATWVPLPQNLGYGGAINATAGDLPPNIDWILVTNPDVSLRPGVIDQLVERGDSDDHIATVGPTILTAEGEVYPSARAVPSLRTGVGHALFANLWLGNPWSRAYRNEHQQSHERRDVGWLSGACVLVRRTVFEELNGFDSGYFMYFEDVDLGFRIGKAGYRNLYEPTATVIHTGAHSTTSDSARMIRAHHDSAIRFLDRKYAGPWLWPIRVALRAGLGVRSWIVRRNLDN